MAKPTRKGRASSSVNVDLSEVETSRKTIPEGTYTVVVDSATQKSSREGNPMIAFEFSVQEGKHKGAKLFENCSLQPQALFKLKSVLIALGITIPNKAFDLDLKDLIGLTCEVEVGHEVYEGKKKARILEYNNPDDSDDSDEDDEEEEDDSDDDLSETLAEMEKEDLISLAEELEINPKAIKKAKKVKDLVDLILEEADEDDIKEAIGSNDDSEDDEDEDDDQDYSEMSLDELKAECKDRGLKITKKMDKEDLIELLEEDDEE